MSVNSSVSTVYEPEDLPPLSLTFVRTLTRTAPNVEAYFGNGAAGAHFNAGQQQTIAKALDRLIAREDEVFAWLEASEANRSLFARDPEAAMRAAVPDFDFTILQELRALAPALRATPNRARSRTTFPLFESPVASADAIPFHVATAMEMNGWDMIVATRQGIINRGLQALYKPQIIDTEVDDQLFGKVKIYVKIGAPVVGTVSGGGRMGRVALPLLEGYLRMQNGTQINLGGGTLTITSNLVAIEAKLQPKPGEGKNYDIFVDIKKDDAVYDVKLQGTSEPSAEALIAATLKAYLKKAGGHEYQLATVNLDKQLPSEISDLVPRVADFTFVEHSTPAETTFAALLLNDPKKPRGGSYFNASMMPSDSKIAALISNEIFISQVVLPALKNALKGQTRSGAAPELKASLGADGSWHISNPSHIDIKHEKYKPWMEKNSLDCFVGDGKLKLAIEIRNTLGATEGKINADVAWKMVLKVDAEGKQTIQLEQVDYRETKSARMEWWGWLIAALFGLIGVIVAAIILLIVYLAIPSLRDNLFVIPMKAIEWPAQSGMKLDTIGLPRPVLVTATPTFINV